MNIYPVIHLHDTVLFPHSLINLNLDFPQSIAAVNAAEVIFEDDGYEKMLFVYQTDSENLLEVNQYGTIGEIMHFIEKSDDNIRMFVRGVERVKILRVFEEDGFVKAEVEEVETIEEQALQDEKYEAMNEILVAEAKKYIENLSFPISWEDLQSLDSSIYLIANDLDINIAKRLAIINELDINKQFEYLFSCFHSLEIKKEVEEKVSHRLKKQIEHNQKEYYLNEHLKAIQKELNVLNDEDDEIEEIKKKILAAKMPKDTEKKALQELNRLKNMPNISSEATVSRIYLEWLCEFPWQKSSKLRNDLDYATKVLNKDHYGLEEIKERILDYLAVQARNPDGKAPILCFVGPPGVGKTSLGKSIAKSTGRLFERISLGGLHDEAEIRGHRRTYIGAQPGKIIQKLSHLGVNNPLILLDEIDKIGQDHRGDPASALLEVLDPAQNHNFSDHYFENNVDLSKILFIATANTIDLPSALLDRMEIIRIAGYTEREKEEIAKNYLLPRQLKEHLLTNKEFKLAAGVIKKIIADYTREAGVRELERQLGKLARKAVRKLNSEVKEVKITPKNLSEFLGTPKFQRDENSFTAKIGLINGLAWTSVGGELLQIEALLLKGKGKLQYTGQLGEVMQESVQTAFSVVKNHLQQQNEALDFENLDLHIHLPEGAIPKDGPSAGIALASVILSALKNIPVRGDIAMTGEISLQGRVLPIGGLKEKLFAAAREGIKTVLIPHDNAKDLSDISPEILDALQIIKVKNITDVFAQVFLKPENKKTKKKTQNKSV